VTPGPIVITATFVGYKAGGLLGALLGTIAVFFPSFLVVTTLAPHYEGIKRSRPVQIMVRGVLAAFIGLLLFVAYRFGSVALVDWRTWLLMAGAWVALWRKVDLLIVVGVGAVLSALLF
jgi:chromate transporter